MTWTDVLSIVQGALFTVSLSLASIVLGLPLGLGVALIRWSRMPIFNGLAMAYVSIVRASPAVTLALLIFFALPTVGLSLDPISAAILTLTLSTGAFNAEIWRGVLLSFPKDQLDAAAAFGMRRGQRFRRIVLPQIIHSALPALVSEMTLQIKSSPAVAVIGIVDITRAAMRVGARTYDPLPPFAVALVLYSFIVWIFVMAQRRIERRREAELAAAA
ncbi:Arginine transport system permease protein ArtQ [Hartmannibacter diazotrophicus]|uniref:Arginine transport system permease protein ArtQ n=1 Tax=Hartmannibacter diazotrophicus TaxID=1482074 RepID=A0A2C9D9Q4_9HYPH|nr:amino acid ABC transporter permease [Hartmannibacter diazotrophicus]SON56963.1 Arginine transport system permease protein ArtQ [Hartmannibacter diazotrophicus]